MSRSEYGFIYAIKNKTNGKLYIGQTLLTPYERWLQHKYDYKKEKYSQKPLYQAMRLEGIDNFEWMMIERCLIEELNEREKHYIQFYHTHLKDPVCNGYNVTMGGEGKLNNDYELIVKEYRKVKNMSEVAKKFGIHPDTVKAALINYGEPIEKMKDVNANKFGKPVLQFSKDGHYLERFRSSREAATELTDNPKKIDGISVHITDVCKGRRKSAYGYVWKYED